ncbi:MAG: family 16 glycosylhydrolase, partial [Pseudomonadota bacterium]
MRAVLAMCGVVCTMGTAIAEDTSFVDSFKSFDAEAWSKADYTPSHPWFDTRWSARHALIDDGLVLKLEPDGGMKGFVSGALRRQEPTGFGRYAAVIQPARGDGLITGFFTYTGPYYGTRHDEIDIEFLGRDTTVMQVSVFVDGEQRMAKVALGFDAADRPRAYSFDWLPDRVVWYVDGQEVHRMTLDGGPLPEVPSMLFANLWAGTPEIQNWSGLAQEQAA